MMEIDGSTNTRGLHESCRAGGGAEGSVAVSSAMQPEVLPPSLAMITTMICTHRQSLSQIEGKLKELLQNQRVLTEGLHGENERFKESQATFNLPGLFGEVSMYTQKLVRLKEDMSNITERTARIKRRAMRLQHLQQQKALNHEQQRAEQLEREKHLIARPAWASHQDG